jgi:two-component system nitrogen regulation sensor histidine kinase NtrY
MSDDISRGPAHGRALNVTSDNTGEYPGSAGRREAAALRRVAMWSSRLRVGRRAAAALFVIASLAAVATFLTLTGRTNFGVGSDALVALIVVDIVLVLALGAAVVQGIVRIWGQRRAGLAAARLHVRLVGLFSVVAVAPAILVLVLSAMFFNVVVQNWFSDRVRIAVENSVRVSDAYLREHEQIIRSDVNAMAQELTQVWTEVAPDVTRMRSTLEDLAERNGVHGALLLDPFGRIISQAGFTSSLTFDLPPAWAFADANGASPVVLTTESRDRVRALAGLDVSPRAFLYVGRFIDPSVLELREVAQRAASDYASAEAAREDLQFQFAAVFTLVTLLLLIIAVAVGLAFANRLTRPIASLVHAAEMVRSGNLGIRIEEAAQADDEIGMLTRSFNRMTRQLDEQRRELTEANRQLDDRRRFTEAVLGGVSAGVIGLDRQGRVSLPNRPAMAMLQIGLDRFMGRPLGESVPEFADIIAKAIRDPDRLVEDDIVVATADAKLTLHVRIAAERDARGEVIGFVVTFDDVTELQSAQRKAAWADVARRIAHEIKNPLTPIQLSAERLKRKYLGEVTTDPEIFAQCTETIVRQVGDIGRMVDEFSAFARMPNPVMKPVDLTRLCRESIVLHDQANPDIAFETDLPDHVFRINCDAGLLSQVLTNLMANAVEAIKGRGEPDAAPGRIRLRLVESTNSAMITIEDNGRGLPVEERERLTEPYVTTRSKGTGLGLAIVARIVEQHGGTLELADRVAEDEPGSGARVTIVLPGDLPAGQDEPGGLPDTGK